MAIAKRFANEGASLICADRNADRERHVARFRQAQLRNSLKTELSESLTWWSASVSFLTRSAESRHLRCFVN
jgi:NAD(P)-dependent dehydrogenase (short-subunit alcohol dehydrogenase family)